MRAGGRKGRRTALMVRLARERISRLFHLAEHEAGDDHLELADRYVALARRIGMRYNVRLLPEYSDAYCRGCSRYWVEGRTVRTRLRSGHRVRTCLACGRERRVPYRPRRTSPLAGARLPTRPRGEAATSHAPVAPRGVTGDDPPSEGR